jgi:chromosome segregation ATPase
MRETFKIELPPEVQEKVNAIHALGTRKAELESRLRVDPPVQRALDPEVSDVVRSDSLEYPNSTIPHEDGMGITLTTEDPPLILTELQDALLESDFREVELQLENEMVSLAMISAPFRVEIDAEISRLSVSETELSERNHLLRHVLEHTQSVLRSKNVERVDISAEIENLRDDITILKGSQNGYRERLLNSGISHDIAYHTLDEFKAMRTKYSESESTISVDLLHLRTRLNSYKSRILEYRSNIDSLRTTATDLCLTESFRKNILDTELLVQLQNISIQDTVCRDKVAGTNSMIEVQRRELMLLESDLARECKSVSRIDDDVSSRLKELESLKEQVAEEDKILEEYMTTIPALTRELDKLRNTTTLHGPFTTHHTLKETQDTLERQLNQLSKIEYELTNGLSTACWELQLLRDRSIVTVDEDTKRVCDEIVYGELLLARLDLDVRLAKRQVAVVTGPLRTSLEMESARLSAEIGEANRLLSELQLRENLIDSQVDVLEKSLVQRGKQRDTLSRKLILLRDIYQGHMRNRSDLSSEQLARTERMQLLRVGIAKLEDLNSQTGKSVEALVGRLVKAEVQKKKQCVELVELNTELKKKLRLLADTETQCGVSQADLATTVKELKNAQVNLSTAERDMSVLQRRIGGNWIQIEDVARVQGEIESINRRIREIENQIDKISHSSPTIPTAVPSRVLMDQILLTEASFARARERVLERRVELESLKRLLKDQTRITQADRDIIAKVSSFKSVCAKTSRKLVSRIAELSTYQARLTSR